MEGELAGTIVGFVKEEGKSKLIIELSHGCPLVPLDKEVRITWEKE